MVVIRLARKGARNCPFYHVVVADKRSPRDGCFIEKIGYLNPLEKKEYEKYSAKVDMDRYKHWISLGAKPSGRVKRLVDKVSKWLD